MREVKTDSEQVEVKEIEYVEEGPAVIATGVPVQSFITFSGADIMMIINGAIIGEAQSIHYEENLEFSMGPAIKGYVEIVVFDNEPGIRKALRTRPDPAEYPSLAMAAANEFGQKMIMAFKDVRFTTRTGKMDVDTVLLHERYHFEASDIVYLNDFEITHTPDGGTVKYATI